MIPANIDKMPLNTVKTKDIIAIFIVVYIIPVKIIGQLLIKLLIDFFDVCLVINTKSLIISNLTHLLYNIGNVIGFTPVYYAILIDKQNISII